MTLLSDFASPERIALDGGSHPAGRPQRKLRVDGDLYRRHGEGASVRELAAICGISPECIRRQFARLGGRV
jgi:hypothetical protein